MIGDEDDDEDDEEDEMIVDDKRRKLQSKRRLPDANKMQLRAAVENEASESERH